MATKTMILNPGDRPDKKQLKETQAASERSIHFTDDAPRLSEKELSEFRPANPKYFRPVKELISLRLDAVLIDAFRSTGKGYQTKINEALWRGAQEMGIIAK